MAWYSDTESDFTDVSLDEDADALMGGGDFGGGGGGPDAVGPTKKWDAFQVTPPEVDTGSAAAMVWVKRFEKLMLILAYVLTFIIIGTAAVIGKGTTFFMIAQVRSSEEGEILVDNFLEINKGKPTTEIFLFLQH